MYKLLFKYKKFIMNILLLSLIYILHFLILYIIYIIFQIYKKIKKFLFFLAVVVSYFFILLLDLFILQNLELNIKPWPTKLQNTSSERSLNIIFSYQLFLFLWILERKFISFHNIVLIRRKKENVILIKIFNEIINNRNNINNRDL